jgi:hypothetical protein
VWHFVHGRPVVCVIFGFANVRRDVTVIVAPAINITASVLADPDKITPNFFEFRIAELLTLVSTDTDSLAWIACQGHPLLTFKFRSLISFEHYQIRRWCSCSARPARGLC